MCNRIQFETEKLFVLNDEIKNSNLANYYALQLSFIGELSFHITKTDFNGNIISDEIHHCYYDKNKNTWSKEYISNNYHEA